MKIWGEKDDLNICESANNLFNIIIIIIIIIIVIIILTKRTHYYNTFFEKKMYKQQEKFFRETLRLNLFGTPVSLTMTLSGSYVTFWIQELKKKMDFIYAHPFLRVVSVVASDCNASC